RCDGDLPINFDVDLMTRDFERSEGEMGRQNIDRTLDNDETISPGLRDASEEEEPDHQHQFFIHGALVGNSAKMLPAFKIPRHSTIRGGRTIFDQILCPVELRAFC